MLHKGAVFDLLSGKDATTGGYGTQAPSSQTMVSSVALESMDDALQLIEIGYGRRGATAQQFGFALEHTHVLMSVKVSCTDKMLGRTTSGKMHIAQIATNYRVSPHAPHAESVHLQQEAAFIAGELDTLRKVLVSLRNFQEPTRDIQRSRLTALMADCLGSGAKCCVCLEISAQHLDASSHLLTTFANSVEPYGQLVPQSADQFSASCSSLDFGDLDAREFLPNRNHKQSFLSNAGW